VPIENKDVWEQHNERLTQAKSALKKDKEQLRRDRGEFFKQGKISSSSTLVSSIGLSEGVFREGQS